MNPKDSEYFKNIIPERHKKALRSEGILESDSINKPGNTDSGDLRYTTHLADLGSDTMGRELDSYFNARAKKYRKHLNEALERIDKGTYGLCLVCSKKIPKEVGEYDGIRQWHCGKNKNRQSSLYR